MKLHIMAVLVILCLGIFTMHTATGSMSTETLRKSSCIELSTKKLNVKRLNCYKKQNIPIKAVMFITKTGKKICVKPDLKWVKDAMTQLDKKGVTARPTTNIKVSIKDC
uniref:Chemokine interleukin-8-like domain-containing protein n=1 Tax=Crocodylus porosus TaxID=8502 RepID=A0A7M4E8H5_CROPO